jgi:regulator of protease activity HflC (stomatin/prohibitin superfamily)
MRTSALVSQPLRIRAVRFFSIFAVGLSLAGCATVGTGYRGVVLSWNRPTGEVKSEGLYFYNPVGTSIVEMNVQVVADVVKCQAVSRDLQQVDTTVTLNYQLDPGKVSEIYDKLRDDYQERIIDPTVQESVKQATARFTASDLIEHRDQVHAQIEQNLSTRLTPFGIEVAQISITDFNFTESFQKAVEDKVAAQQALLTAQIQAKTAITSAEGQARAQALQHQTLTPLLVQLKAIDKWDGKLPQVTSGAMPLVSLPGLSGPVPVKEQGNP